MKPSVFFGLLGTAVVGSAALTFANPTIGSSVFMASGAAFLATSVAKEEAEKRDKLSLEANKVGSAFKYLYELNSGLVLPAQLAFHSDIVVERANNFLTQLAVTQGGSAVNTEVGQAYVFPHPKNVLEDIEKKYLSYAENQITVQTQQMQQQLMQMQQQLTLLATRSNPSAQQTPTEEKEDPWNKLV